MTARPVPSEAEVLARLVSGGVATRIADGDPALWPRVARPGWTGAVRAARPLSEASLRRIAAANAKRGNVRVDVRALHAEVEDIFAQNGIA